MKRFRVILATLLLALGCSVPSSAQSNASDRLRQRMDAEKLLQEALMLTEQLRVIRRQVAQKIMTATQAEMTPEEEKVVIADLNRTMKAMEAKSAEMARQVVAKTEQAEKLMGNFPSAHVPRATLYKLLGDKERSLQEAQAAIRKLRPMVMGDNGDDFYLLYLVQAYIALDQYGTARQDFSTYVNRLPAKRQQNDLLKTTRKLLDDSEMEFKKKGGAAPAPNSKPQTAAVPKPPAPTWKPSPDTPENRAKADAYLKQASAKIREIEQITAKNGGQVTGKCRQLGKEAMALCTEAYRAVHNYGGADIVVGRVYEAVGAEAEHHNMMQQAVKHLKPIVEKGGKDHASVINLAEAYKALGEYAQARDVLNTCLARYPDDENLKIVANGLLQRIQWAEDREKAEE